MTVQSLNDGRHAGHLVGDVPALFLVAAVLAWLCPQARRLGGGSANASTQVRRKAS
jgi:hypothetical protein